MSPRTCIEDAAQSSQPHLVLPLERNERDATTTLYSAIMCEETTGKQDGIAWPPISSLRCNHAPTAGETAVEQAANWSELQVPIRWIL